MLWAQRGRRSRYARPRTILPAPRPLPPPSFGFRVPMARRARGTGRRKRCRLTPCCWYRAKQGVGPSQVS